MIDTPIIYNTMKIFARQAMKNSAESRGVQWDAHVRRLQTDPELHTIKQQMERPCVKYPEYYLKPFHAYDHGNLDWLAAFEVEPATYAMGIRTFKDDTTISPEGAFIKMREAMTNAMKDYHTKHGLPQPQTIVDMGCSTGISTRWMAAQWPDATFTGIDLSPHFLSLAEQAERKRVASGQPRRIHYRHGLAEESALPDHSVDMVAFNFVIHECPGAAITSFIKEARRVLKPGGVLTFVDNNPRSKTIQNLPPPIFALMKSTEPHSDEYYAFDLEAAYRAAGFKEVVTIETDHRHRTVMGIAPQ